MVSGRWADMWIHECISDFIPFLFLFSYTEGCRQQMGETDWVFWSQQWNICFNSFILGLQVGILNQIQSNLVGKPMCVCVCVCVRVLSCVRLFATPWAQPTRLLYPWNFPVKTGVGSHALPWGWKLCLMCILHWQVDSLSLSHLCSCYYLWTEY